MGGAPVIETVRAGVQFAPAAAASFRRVEADWGSRIDINRTYADYDTQMGMFLAWNRYVASGYDRALYPGHSRALHPDKSMHCRGLALDSDDWQKRGFNEVMAEHGWIRTAADDPTERHHYEYQVWRDEHRFDQAPAGDGSQAFDPEEEDMTPEQVKQLAELHAWMTSVERGGSGGVQVFQRVPGNPEWMVVDPTFAPLKGTTQDGYRVTTDVGVARVWGRQYSGQGSEAIQLDRDAYNAQQVWARARAAEYRAAQVALIREALKP